MDLVKNEKKKRLIGIGIGVAVPIVLLLIVGVYGYFFSRPFMTSEKGMTYAASNYLYVLYFYLISSSYYHVFFCLSGNMLTVFYLTNKNQNSMANGVIVPTAIFALILVAIRLL